MQLTLFAPSPPLPELPPEPPAAPAPKPSTAPRLGRLYLDAVHQPWPKEPRQPAEGRTAKQGTSTFTYRPDSEHTWLHRDAWEWLAEAFDWDTSAWAILYYPDGDESRPPVTVVLPEACGDFGEEVTNADALALLRVVEPRAALVTLGPSGWWLLGEVTP